MGQFKHRYKYGTMLYLAGPITSDKGARKTFKEAQHALEGAGYTVVNPFEIDPSRIFTDFFKLQGDEKEHAHLRADIAEMMKCDGIATLPLNTTSSGMARELHLAHSLCMTVMPFEWWIPRGTDVPF